MAISKSSASRPQGEYPAARTKRSGRRQDEIGGFDMDSECCAEIAALVGEAIGGCPQRSDQVLAVLMGDQFDGIRLPGKKRFHRRAGELDGVRFPN